MYTQIFEKIFRKQISLYRSQGEIQYFAEQEYWSKINRNVILIEGHFNRRCLRGPACLKEM